MRISEQNKILKIKRKNKKQILKNFKIFNFFLTKIIFYLS